jgi:propionyl-CoA carboxylase alpha chain
VAVVEAMKMQNVIRAAKKGVIQSIHYKPGASLKVDDIIMDFE